MSYSFEKLAELKEVLMPRSSAEELLAKRRALYEHNFDHSYIFLRSDRAINVCKHEGMLDTKDRFFYFSVKVNKK